MIWLTGCGSIHDRAGKIHDIHVRNGIGGEAGSDLSPFFLVIVEGSFFLPKFHHILREAARHGKLTLEQQIANAQRELRQLQNRQKLLENKMRSISYREQTHRLCVHGGGLESVFSVLAGYVLMPGSTLSGWELLGCGLVFAAVVLVQLAPGKTD